MLCKFFEVQYLFAFLFQGPEHLAFSASGKTSDDRQPERHRVRLQCFLSVRLVSAFKLNGFDLSHAQYLAEIRRPHAAAPAMVKKFFSVSEILGLIDHFQKSRSHKTEPGLDRFRLTFLLIVNSDSNAFFVIKDGDIFCFVHMTPLKFLFRPYVGYRKGRTQFEKFVNLKDHVAKITKRGGLPGLNNALSIRE